MRRPFDLPPSDPQLLGERGAPHAVSRRGFLLGSAGSLLLVVAAAPIGVGCEGSSPGWRLLLSDPALCGACRRCAITCSSLREGHPGAARGKTDPDPIYQRLAFRSGRWYANTCRMCPEKWVGDRLVEPKCVAVCPTGAAHIERPTDPAFGGAELRVIDPAACIGCRSCERNCPHGHPTVFDDRAHKCDLCLGHYATPPCAEECPSSALSVLDYWSEQPPRPFPWDAIGESGTSGEGLGGDG